MCEQPQGSGCSVLWDHSAGSRERTQPPAAARSWLGSARLEEKGLPRQPAFLRGVSVTRSAMLPLHLPPHPLVLLEGLRSLCHENKIQDKPHINFL